MSLRTVFLSAAFTVAACTLSLPAQAATITGRVVRVHDGDTITVLVGRDQVRVRLARIDAPERPGQPYSSASRDALAALVAGKIVRVTYSQQDQWGRPIGEVDAGGINANTAQVRAGYAWVFRKYNRDPVDRALEVQARLRRAGLWADPAPTPPWEWRAAKRER